MDELIQQGRELLDRSRFSSSRQTLWEVRCRRVLTTEYDEEMADHFSGIFASMVIMGDGDLYSAVRQKIEEGIEFLEALQETSIPKKPAEAGTPSGDKLRTITVQNGNVILGNNNTATNVTMETVLTGLEREIRAKVTNEDEKRTALAQLKDLTSNPSLAAVIGQSLGAFLSHAIK